MNRWDIPKWLEEAVIKRDKNCVYCGIKNGSRKAKATWEHIINDARIVTIENIARCCASCNSSKGIKTLFVWINSDYCKEKGINKNTVSKVIKDALKS